MVNIFFLVYSRKILKYATEIVASGAFWGPNFALQGPTKVYIFVVYSRNILKNATEMLAFVHSKVLFFVLQGSTNAYVLLCIFTQLKNNYIKKKYHWNGGLWCILRS